MKRSLSETVILKARKLFEESGMTLEELGLKMGCSPGTARRSVWQLFNKSPDPRLSTVEKLAAALGVEVKELI